MFVSKVHPIATWTLERRKYPPHEVFDGIISPRVLLVVFPRDYRHPMNSEPSTNTQVEHVHVYIIVVTIH